MPLGATPFEELADLAPSQSYNLSEKQNQRPIYQLPGAVWLQSGAPLEISVMNKQIKSAYPENPLYGKAFEAAVVRRMGDAKSIGTRDALGDFAKQPSTRGRIPVCN